ncbi:MAG TPA: hypothetical protein VF269_04560 [Rhodanobacteraceae bacterium]
MALQSSPSRKSMAIWTALVSAAVLIIGVAIYGVTRPPAPAGQPQSAVIVSYRYLPVSRICGSGRLEANVRLNDGEIVRAGAYQHDPVRNGMRVTVERRRSLCLTAPYAILQAGPVDSSLQRRPVAGHH